MTTTQTSLPKWILIVSLLFAVMELVVGASMWFSPTDMLENVDTSAKGVSSVIQMWAVRQVALGIIFAFAAWKRSVPMLTVAYVFFLVMFLGDLLIGIQQHENGLIGSAIAMSAISSAILYVLNKRKTGAEMR